MANPVRRHVGPMSAELRRWAGNNLKAFNWPSAITIRAPRPYEETLRADACLLPDDADEVLRHAAKNA